MGVQCRDKRALLVYRSALGIDQQFARAVDAVKLRFVSALDALLAYQESAGIGGAIDMGKVRFADGTDVAQRMYRHVAVGVGACLARSDVHTLKFKAAYRELTDILIGHA